jgi:hypothetical protein
VWCSGSLAAFNATGCRRAANLTFAENLGEAGGRSGKDGEERS